MIDPGKLLGGLLGGRTALGGLGQGSKGMMGNAAAGMGLLGVAMAAFEHFSQQKAAAAPAPSTNTPPSFFSGSASATPPPAPGFAVAPPPPPPGSGVGPSFRPDTPGTAGAQPAAWASPPSNQADPFLLIRAMIAAAKADGVLDHDERARILGQLEQSGLSAEEKNFLHQEFEAPWSVARLAAAVPSPEVAAQVLAVSLVAIDVDTRAEEEHLENLRQALGLSVEQARVIARSVGKIK